MVQQSLRRNRKRHVSKISIRFRKIPAQSRVCEHCGRSEMLAPDSPSIPHTHAAHTPTVSHTCIRDGGCEDHKWQVDSGRGNEERDPNYSPTFRNSNSKSSNFKRLRSTHLEKSIEAKKHVIRMLFVVVLEFFLCWTPIFVVNILCLYVPEQVYRALGSVGISFLHLLSYASSCCNPITYCFMNKKFLQGFRHAFGCRKEADRLARQNGTAASFRSQSNNIFKVAMEVKRDARETTV